MHQRVGVDGMTLEQVWAVVVTAVITGLVGFVFGYLRDTNNEHKAEQHRREKQFNELIESNREVLAELKTLQEKYDRLNSEVLDLKQKLIHMVSGGKVLLRDRIIQSCRVFIERGSITLTAQVNIKDMFHWYHDELNGNGTAEYYFKKMMKLPVVDDEPLVSHINLDSESEYDVKE